MIELARAIIVNNDHEPIARHGLDLKFAPDTRQKNFADSGHNETYIPLLK